MPFGCGFFPGVSIGFPSRAPFRAGDFYRLWMPVLGLCRFFCKTNMPLHVAAFHIINDMDCITERRVEKSYACGFRNSAKILLEHCFPEF